jgi:hypothetical protein
MALTVSIAEGLAEAARSERPVHDAQFGHFWAGFRGRAEVACCRYRTRELGAHYIGAGQWVHPDLKVALCSKCFGGFSGGDLSVFK